jgi:nucleoside-diphosphate-sugar epimerase
MQSNYSSSVGVKKVLVTGGTGFIGKHLLVYLGDKNYSIRLLARNRPPTESYTKPGVKIFLGNLNDRSCLAEACEDVDVIIHLAGLAHVNNVDRSSLEEINVRGTEKLLSIAIEKGVSRFIFLSSSLAANSDSTNEIDYGLTKLRSEEALLEAHLSEKIEAVVLRPVNIYGRGMRGNIASLISMIHKGIMPPLPQLDTEISLIGVEDVCQAIGLAIESKAAKGKIYSLTDGLQYSVNDIEKSIYEVVGRKVPGWKTPLLLMYLVVNIAGVIGKSFGALGIRIPIVSDISSRTYENLVSENLFDNSLACAELGFKPTTTFFNSLRNILSGHT